MPDHMASSGLRENVILTKIILTTDGTNKVQREIWSQGGWHPQGRTIRTTDVDVNHVFT